MDDVVYLTEDFIPVQADDPRMFMVKVRQPDGKIVFGRPVRVQGNQKLFRQTFEGHEGRPGKVGGSVPAKAKKQPMSQEEFNDRVYGKFTSIDDMPDNLYEVTSSDIADTSREYHNDESQEKLNSLIDAVSDKAGRMIALEDIKSRVKFDVNGNVILYRGGNDTGLSWTTDRKWAERFATYRYGMKEKETAKVFEKQFNIDDILYALPWEGEVIVRTGVKHNQKLFHSGGEGSGNYGYSGRMVGESGKDNDDEG